MATPMVGDFGALNLPTGPSGQPWETRQYYLRNTNVLVTTFTVCAFWMADALWGASRQTEAKELFSSVIHKANQLGLFSEDMDPETGELWGNFPQTYSHVGLINTAMRISQSWDDAF